jgi:hypothetical protein
VAVDLIHRFVKAGAFERVSGLQKQMALDAGVGLQIKQHDAGFGVGVAGLVDPLQGRRCD